MKPSILVFAATAAMSLCFIVQLLQGRIALAVAALLITVFGYAITLILEQEENSK
jgi:hypothetical protein